MSRRFEQRIVDTMIYVHNYKEMLDDMKPKITPEADLVNGSKDGEMSRNTWACEDAVYHYCPVCDTLEKCKDQEEPNCRFSTFNGTHHLCALKINLKWM